MRYDLFRKEYDKVMVDECLDAMEKNMDFYKFQMHLLKTGFKKDEIYEILFIFEKINGQLMKGGQKIK